MPPEKRTLVLTHFPRFLTLLEEEIYSQGISQFLLNKGQDISSLQPVPTYFFFAHLYKGSPIWDPEFTGKTPAHVIAAAQAAANADSSAAAAAVASKKRPHSEEETDQPEAKRRRLA